MAADSLLGTVLAGTEIQSVLGEGAAARVYRARRLADGRPFAIKILTDTARRGLLERFRREARALRRICHPNVLAVFDSGTMPDGRPYLMMELLEGRTLSKLLELFGPMSGPHLKEIAMQIASGLAAAHERGLVHRDLKPSNLMLVETAQGERVKILDFGVVRTTQTHGSTTALTKSEVLLGTPRYMSPEQVMSPNSAGPSTDLYALGVILYEMLTGRPPFEGSVVEMIDQQLHRRPQPLRTNTGLEPLVMELLEKDPLRRPPSATSLLAMLERLDVVEGAQPASLLDQAVGRRGTFFKKAAGVVLKRNEQAHEDRTVRDIDRKIDLEPPTYLGPDQPDPVVSALFDPATLFDVESGAPTFAEHTESDLTNPDLQPAPTRIVDPARPITAPKLKATPISARSYPKLEAPPLPPGWRPTPFQIGLSALVCFVVSAIVSYAARLP